MKSSLQLTMAERGRVARSKRMVSLGVSLALTLMSAVPTTMRTITIMMTDCLRATCPIREEGLSTRDSISKQPESTTKGRLDKVVEAEEE